jgi:hypothetical protein
VVVLLVAVQLRSLLHEASKSPWDKKLLAPCRSESPNQAQMLACEGSRLCQDRVRVCQTRGDIALVCMRSFRIIFRAMRRDQAVAVVSLVVPVVRVESIA